MRIETNGTFARGLPIALVVTLALQAGAAIWWLSARARDNVFLERRVAQIESVLSKTSEATASLHERLARIEERLSAQGVLLARIEKQTSGR